MNGWKDGQMDGCVPLAMPQSSTSVTKNGTDGGPGLAGIQGTKWHATTGPDGLRLSVLFFVFEQMVDKQGERQRSKEIREKQ